MGDDPKTTIRFDVEGWGKPADTEPEPERDSRWNLAVPIGLALANTAIGLMLLKRGVSRDTFEAILGLVLLTTSVLSYWELADYLAGRKDQDRKDIQGEDDRA